jgi:hypothetical protein
MAESGQGYKLTIYFAEEPLEFANCRVRNMAEEIDTTASLITDEDTGEIYGINGAYNTFGGGVIGAFTDAAGGPQTLFVDFSGTIRNPLVLSYLVLLQPGDKVYTEGQAEWAIWYNGLMVYEAFGFYVQELDIGAVVRGAADVTFRIRSIQYGYQVNTALN